jgi:hypothetical protein
MIESYNIKCYCYYFYETKIIMFTSDPHSVRGSESMEVEMYTSETSKNIEMKFVLKLITASSWCLVSRLTVTF